MAGVNVLLSGVAESSLNCQRYPCAQGQFCTYANYSLWPCQRCPLNQFSADGITCSFCTPGNTASRDQSSCARCAAGRAGITGVCDECTVGKYRHFRNASTSCLDCPAGTQSEKKNRSRCTACTGGKFSPGELASTAQLSGSSCTATQRRGWCRLNPFCSPSARCVGKLQLLQPRDGAECQADTLRLVRQRRHGVGDRRQVRALQTRHCSVGQQAKV